MLSSVTFLVVNIKHDRLPWPSNFFLLAVRDEIKGSHLVKFVYSTLNPDYMLLILKVDLFFGTFFCPIL